MKRGLVQQWRPALGDLGEEYRLIAGQEGRWMGVRWLARQFVLTGFRLIYHQLDWGIDMLKSHMTTALRNFRRHRSTALINLTGLTVGLTASLLILAFVSDDLSYDRFNTHRDTVYRVIYQTTHQDRPFVMAPTMLPLAPALAEGYPEIEAVARISQISGFPYAVEDRIFRERLYFVDAAILDILDLPLKWGDKATALAEPNGLILTEEQASRFFGNENPLGRTIELDRGKIYTVTGVFKKYPRQSHLRLSGMASIVSQYDTPRHQAGSWDSFANDYTYIRLKKGTDPAALEAKFDALLHSHLAYAESDGDHLRLQRLLDIHFTAINYDYVWASNKDMLVGFTAVGLFILLIACFNFINLTTARIAQRTREVGIRKVAGAQRFELVRQFLAESTVLSVLSLVLALGLALALLPSFGVLVERTLERTLLLSWNRVPVYLGLAMGVGVLAGLYPALQMAGIQPLTAFRQSRQRQTRRFSPRTLMVILQFSISIFLIIATMTVHRQRQYMLHKSLGFAQDQVVALELHNTPVHGRTEALKSGILSHPGVLSAGFSHSVPASGFTTASTYRTVGEAPREVYLYGVLSDGDLVKTLGLALTAGRDFSIDHGTDATDAVLVNETAAAELGWADPIGQCVTSDGRTYRIIGVVKDAHFDSMQEKINPMVFSVNKERINYLSVRYDPAQAVDVKRHIHTVWERVMPGGYTLRLHDFDEAFGRYYRFEQRMNQIFTVCAGLALAISCLGMIALAAFVVNRRLKEVGIRKVLGASTLGLSGLLASSFLKWVMAAAVVAVPLAYWLMGGWLNEYAYRTSLPWWLAILGVGLALVASVASVGLQTWRASRVEPVSILKQE